MKNTDGFDASLFHRGICCNAFDYFGAHKKSNKVMFRVWAPNADKVYLVGKAMLVHHALDPSVQLGQRLGFIVQGYDYGNIHGNLIMNSEF